MFFFGWWLVHPDKILHRAANLLYYIHKQCLVLTHLFSQWELELSTCTVSTGGILLALTPTPPSKPGNGGKAVASRSNCNPFEEFVPVLSLFRGRGLPPEVGLPLPIMDDALPGPITSSSFLLRRCLQSQQRRNQPTSPNAATWTGSNMCVTAKAPAFVGLVLHLLLSLFLPKWGYAQY